MAEQPNTAETGMHRWRLEVEFDGDRDHFDLDADIVTAVWAPVHKAASNVAEFVGGQVRSVKFGRIDGTHNDGQEAAR